MPKWKSPCLNYYRFCWAWGKCSRQSRRYLRDYWIFPCKSNQPSGALGPFYTNGCKIKGKWRTYSKKMTTFKILNVKSIITSMFQKMLESAPSHQLADIISAIVNATFKEKLDVLNSVNLKDRYVRWRLIFEPRLTGFPISNCVFFKFDKHVKERLAITKL